MTTSNKSTNSSMVSLRSAAATTMAVATLFCLGAASAFTAAPSPSSILGAGTRNSLFQLSVSAAADNSMDYAQVSATSSSAQPVQQAKKQKQQQQRLEWDWRTVVQEAWKMDSRPIIMFDGDCNLCNGGVNMLLDMDTNNEFRFCSLSSKFGQSLLVAHGKEPDDRDNILVIEPLPQQSSSDDATTTTNIVVQSHSLQKSQAVMAIVQRLEGAPAWVKAMTKVGTVAPSQVSDWFLQLVADNRHTIGDAMEEDYSSCRIDFDGEYDGRFLNDYEHTHLFEPYNPEEDIKKKFNDIIFS